MKTKILTASLVLLCGTMFGKDLGIVNPCAGETAFGNCTQTAYSGVGGRTKVMILIPDVASVIKINNVIAAGAGVPITLIAPAGDTFAPLTLGYTSGTGFRIIAVQ